MKMVDFKTPKWTRNGPVGRLDKFWNFKVVAAGVVRGLIPHSPYPPLVSDTALLCNIVVYCHGRSPPFHLSSELERRWIWVPRPWGGFPRVAIRQLHGHRQAREQDNGYENWMGATKLARLYHRLMLWGRESFIIDLRSCYKYYDLKGCLAPGGTLLLVLAADKRPPENRFQYASIYFAASRVQYYLSTFSGYLLFHYLSRPTMMAPRPMWCVGTWCSAYATPSSM